MALSDAKPFAVANWRLDEASGNALDSVGSETLTETGTVGATTGKLGGARVFGAIGDPFFSRSDDATLSAGDIRLMLRCWVKLTSKTGSTQAIIAKGNLDGGGTSEYELVYQESADRFRFFVSNDGSTLTGVTADAFGAVSTDTWYLIHAWHDSVANQFGIAVNGGTANTTSYSSGIFDGTGTFYLSRDSTARFMHGHLDDVVILKGYILDATERTADYNGGTGIAFADWDAAPGGRTTHNTRSHPLGIRIGQGWRTIRR